MHPVARGTHARQPASKYPLRFAFSLSPPRPPALAPTLALTAAFSLVWLTTTATKGAEVTVPASASSQPSAQSRSQPQPAQPPASQEIPARLHVHATLDVSLFTGEPDVVDPVAICFDEFGRCFVVEMRDYPYGIGDDHRPGGTIRLLEDTDGDGKPDRATVFATDLRFPTSITPWRGGVLVTAPPEIVFLKDTNGDGRADVRQTVLNGFVLGVTDSNLNGLRWGPDNWVHGVNGGNGGRVRSPKNPSAVLDLGERDFRFHPDTGQIEPTTHTGGGFGLVFDTWGNSFTTYNINHIQQRVANVGEFTRLPRFPSVETTHSISDHGEGGRVYPASVAQTRPNHPEQAGHFSAAGGMGFLGHRGWPESLHGSVLVGDVSGNIVHRDRLRPDGPIFTASRAPEEQTSEFLASQDGACRPIGMEMGPDGALYIVDMQRDVIEHPDYIPAKLRAKLDLRAGDDRGRIYRLFPKNTTFPHEDLPGKVPPARWVALLESPNPWTRSTAQRLIVDGSHTNLEASLRQLLATSKEPASRLHALWSLDGLALARQDDFDRALADAHPGVRAAALRLAKEQPPAKLAHLAPSILPRTLDPDCQVRFEAALALASIPETNTPPEGDRLEALTSILAIDAAYPWSRRAVLAAAQGCELALLQRLLTQSKFDALQAEAREAALSEVADLIAARAGTTSVAPDSLTAVLEMALDPKRPENARAATLRGLLDGLRRNPTPPSASKAARSALASLSQTNHGPLFLPAWKLSRVLGIEDLPAHRQALQLALKVVADAERPVEERLQNLQLLAMGQPSETLETLANRLRGVEPAPIQQAALEILRDIKEPAVGQALVDAWPNLAPSLRSSVVNILVYHNQFHEPLVAALEKGILGVGELNLDLEQRRRLLRRSSAAIAQRAAKFVSDEEYSNRSATVDAWLPKLPAKGDATLGQEVFVLRCATCHKVAGTGHSVGPDLTGIAHRSVEDIVSNILDPNMAINPSYIAFLADLKNGDSETGLLAAEAGDTVVLLQADERKVQIQRRDLTQLRSTGKSLMPEGLETGLTPQQLRDLVAFLQESR